jgi:hypothetical protein
MRFQLDKAYRQFVESCKSKITAESNKMLSKTNIDNLQV